MAKINKKAILFSIVSLFLVILLVSSTELLTQFRESESEIEVTRTRVKLLNSLIEDMENVYFDKMLYTSSKNALVGISHYYTTHNIDYRLYRALNMTIWDGIYRDGDDITDLTTVGCGGPCMESEYTLNNLIENIKQDFNYLGINPDISIQITSVTQEDPWHIQVEADINYVFTDISNIASWKGVTQRTVNVSVFGIYGNINKGIITSHWKRDNGTDRTEPNVVNMLEGTNIPPYANGICPPNSGCDEE